MQLHKPVTVRELADFLEIPFAGEAEREVTGINEIHKVREGDLTFVDVPKYYDKVLRSAASVVIINKKMTPPEGKSLLISQDPFSDYNRLVEAYKSEEIPPWFSGPDDRIANGKNLNIGEDITIYPGVVIGNNVTIGDGCVLYANVVLYDDTHLGNNVVVHANTVIGSHAYYYKTRENSYEKMISCGRVIVEDNVEIGAGCTIDKGVSGDTVIGEGTKLDNQVHVGHGAVIGKRCLIGAQVGIGGKVIIEDGVILWGQAGVTKSVRIGAGALVSAQSGVSKSLEGGKTYFGTPAQEIRQAQRQMAWLRGQSRKNGKAEE